ncbi:type II secretion system protein E [Halobacillus andaensis]|uniref:Type II secretion system protein E n=1 Tax=Halobacillus andaensis TaxID=1176239 RepID=A0A917B5T5_HALAA|nr:CpaF family protein [Halobacillus andaensis]MBP2006061.1 pilus assembly protein CpaF [Halobacillus andaensis]GGF23886.1 type II secretion system protein E [Halobacillus andaensis]
MSLLKRLGKEELIENQPKKQSSPLLYNRKVVGDQLESKLHNFLVEEMKKIENLPSDAYEPLIEQKAEDFFRQEGKTLSFEDKQIVLKQAKNELLGFGPITSLLGDEMVTEVMVNGPHDVYVEKEGKIERTDVSFRDNDHIVRLIEKIVHPLGRRIDESSPMVDARLPDGSRVNAIIPPLSLQGPTITIRKFSERPFTIQDFLNFNTLSPEMAEFIEKCVKSKLNIFISGGTGSGKTSTLNVLSSFIPDDERIITIEDAAELKLSQDHVVSLEARPANLEGEGAITIRDLVKNSLRMRPDRIIIGEVRSAEALDMLQAMNTGHEGSLGTGHANSPRDLLARLETMVLMAGFELPIRAIREQIAGALDLIVHQERLKNGKRKVTHITEVLGLEGDTIVLQDIFKYNERRVLDENSRGKGRFETTGIRPYCADRLEMEGFTIPASWYLKEWE